MATYYQYVCKIRLPFSIFGIRANVDFSDDMSTSALFVYSSEKPKLKDIAVTKTGKKLTEIEGIEIRDRA